MRNFTEVLDIYIKVYYTYAYVVQKHYKYMKGGHYYVMERQPRLP